MNSDTVNMAEPLIEMIPEKAEITVSVTNGNTFTGMNTTTPELRRLKILQLSQPTEYPDNGVHQIFRTHYGHIVTVEFEGNA